jgi:putative membrane protein
VLTLTVPAAAQAAAQPGAPAGINQPAQAQTQAAYVSAQDRAYLRQAHRGNLAEIAAGRAALRTSHDRDVRAIAWRLIRDHRRLDARMRETAHRLRVGLPDAPSAAQQDALKAVLARSGHRFDRAWLRLQADAHAQALALGRRELRDGHSGQVKDLARDSAPVIRHHLHAVRAELNDHSH